MMLLFIRIEVRMLKSMLDNLFFSFVKEYLIKRSSSLREAVPTRKFEGFEKKKDDAKDICVHEYLSTKILVIKHIFDNK